MARIKNGTIYKDFTGKFTVTSMQDNKCMLFLYHYDSNAILIRPVRIDQIKKH